MIQASDVRSVLSHYGYRERHEGIYSRVMHEEWALWIAYTGAKNPSMLLAGVCSKEFFDLLKSCTPTMRLPVPKNLRLTFDVTPTFNVRGDAVFRSIERKDTAAGFAEIVDLFDKWLTVKANYTGCLDCLETYCKHAHIYPYHKPVLLTLLGREDETELHFKRWLSHTAGEPEIVRSSITYFISELRKRRGRSAPTSIPPAPMSIPQGERQDG